MPVYPQPNSNVIVDNEVPAGLVNGSNTVYTTASSFQTNSLNVYRNGVRQKGGGVDYTVNAGNNGFTMVSAPLTGDLLLVDYNIYSANYILGSNSVISAEVPTGTINSVTTAFTTSHAYIAGTLEVYVDGIHQRRTTDYVETTPGSGVFTFVAAPITGQSVVVNYQFNLNPSSNADTVDGIHASSTATANQLFALDGSATFPQTVIQATKLGYVEITSSFAIASATPTQVTGLTSTVTVPAGGRSVKLTVFAPALSNSGVNTATMTLWDGVVNSGTQLANAICNIGVATAKAPATIVKVVTPAAGSKTYNVGLAADVGTATLTCGATGPASILAELI